MKQRISLNENPPTPPRYMAIPLFIFFPNPPLLARHFRQYRPNEIPNKHKINSCGKVISSFLED